MTDDQNSRPCPICGKPRQERWRPFCSRRCADLDLHRWLTGRYAIPVVEQDDEEEPAVLPADGDETAR